MGNLFSSKNKDKCGRKKDDIEKRLVYLEHIYRNNDKKISHKISHLELNLWWENKMKVYMKEKEDLECQLKDTRNELNRVKSFIKDQNEIEKSVVNNEVSKIHVEEFVEKLMKDEEINISWLPDMVEKQIYINVFNMILKILSDSFNYTSVSIINHKLKVKLSPS